MSDDKIAELLSMRPLEDAREDMKISLPANSFNQEEIKPAENLPVPAEVAEPQLPTVAAEPQLPTVAEKNADENLKDIELAKKNIENIIQLGDDSVKEMVEIAKQSESPRAFEVVSTLMKTLLDANKDYVEMSTKKRYAKEEKQAETQVTNNNLIVSTADLLKMIKGEDE
jgi:hypothetical protein